MTGEPAEDPDVGSPVDLNADLGEGMGDDEAMLALVTSANVACGGHAGDEITMLATCRAAAQRGVVVGAHPSYEDRPGFGRVALEVEPAVLRTQLLRQVRALESAAREVGTRVRYLKPHGALYHRMGQDPEIAQVVLDVARHALSETLPLLCLPGTEVTRLAPDSSVPAVIEGFADRAARTDGSLIPRDEPGAVLTDPAQVTDNVLALAGSVRSVCVHGDTPGAVGLARAARTALAESGHELAPFVATS